MGNINMSGVEEDVGENVTRHKGDKSDWAVLEKFYSATNGDEWSDNTNWMSDAPLYSWKGVETDDRTGGGTGLHLSGNRLTGKIPGRIGNLSELKVLALSHNYFTTRSSGLDYFPLELEALDLELEALDLELGALELEASDPLDLELGALELEASDPPRLQPTGRIPDDIGKLSKLGELHLSNSGLTGQIPDGLRNLSKLFCLNLSDNQLEGDLDWATTVRRVNVSGNPGLKAPPPYASLESRKLEKWWEYLFVTIGLVLTILDVASDVLAAMTFYRINRSMFIAQVCVIGYPNFPLWYYYPRLPWQERLLQLTLLAPVVEGVRALRTGVQSGPMREMRLVEAFNSTLGSVVQLCFLLTYDADSSDFLTILMALVAGVASTTFTLVTSLSVNNADDLQYEEEDPLVVRGVLYFAQVITFLMRYGAIFASVKYFGLVVLYWGQGMRIWSLGCGHGFYRPTALIFASLGLLKFYLPTVRCMIAISKRRDAMVINDNILALSWRTLRADSMAEPGYTPSNLDVHEWAYFRIRIVTLVESALAIGLLYGLQASTETGRTVVLVTLVAALAVQHLIQPIYYHCVGAKKREMSGQDEAIEICVTHRPTEP